MSSNEGGWRSDIQLTTIALVLILAPAATGQTGQKRQAADGEIKQQVLDVNRRMEEASLRNDIEELDRLMADDYVAVGPRGQKIGNKDSVLSPMRAGRLKIKSLKNLTLRVRLVGARAVITGEEISRVELNGHLFTFRSKGSEVFERRNGQWQLVQTRIVRVIVK